METQERLIEGLTSKEAFERLSADGFNELPSQKQGNIARVAIEVMKEPMFFLLLGCSTLYIVLGDYREGIVMLSSIFIIISITFYQSRKTQNALMALKALSTPQILVKRDGKLQRVPSRELVVGDIVSLSEGERIPTDARLVGSTYMNVDESLLTGESVPVLKTGQDPERSMLFSGTMIVSGQCLAHVTAIGTMTRIGAIGKSLAEVGSDQSRLQHEMKRFIKILFVIGLGICAAIVAAFYFSTGSFIRSLLNGLAAAMAIVPEEFSVVLTVFLALGAWRLSQINVLARKPSAIEAIGAVNVLCSDKTGTITQNAMEIVRIHTASQTIGKASFQNEQRVSELIATASLACSENTQDPMEMAIKKLAATINAAPHGYKLVKTYALAPDCFAMTNLVENASVLTACCKGAPETVIQLCWLGEREAQMILAEATNMASSGLRVLGVARASGIVDVPDTQRQIQYGFIGLIGFEDPVRPEVKDAVSQCQDAGIRVVMITGDFPETAKNIAAQIGLASSNVLTGTEMEELDDFQLGTTIAAVDIFARVVPQQKLRIVRALKANGYTVAMTGDGINDAPALKAADVGIAMGKRGTDVAREAASIVLTDDNFASIVNAIRSGRRIYDNLQKAMAYIVAMHIPIIVLALIPAIFPSMPPFLLPLHIIFMELIIDPVCSVVFESEQEEQNIMSRKPRSSMSAFFGLPSISKSASIGLALSIVTLVVYLVALNNGMPVEHARGKAFITLVTGNIFMALSTLSKTRSFVSVILEKNVPAALILTVALLLLGVIMAVPACQDLFKVSFAGFEETIEALMASAAFLATLEIVKFIKNNRNRQASKAINDTPVAGL